MTRRALSAAVALACSFVAHAADLPFLDRDASNLPADRVPVEFLRGHDFRKVAAIASRAPPKTEFETEDAYRLRLDEWAAQQTVGSTRLTGLFLRTGILRSFKDQGDNDVHYRYDAERKVLELCSDDWPRDLFGPDGQRGKGSALAIHTDRSKVREYTGTNALGAKARVRSWRTNATQLLLAGSSTSCFSQTSMDPAEAARMVEGALWGLVLQLQAPYAFRAEEYVEPTFQNPIEVATFSVNLPAKVVRVFLFQGRETPYRELAPP